MVIEHGKGEDRAKTHDKTMGKRNALNVRREKILIISRLARAEEKIINLFRDNQFVIICG